MNLGKFVWRNGKFVVAEDATISVVNHALHYGSGVFEGVRFYKTASGSAIFRLDDHTDRLFYSASVLELEIPFSREEINSATVELLRKNGFESGYIRPVAMFGEGKMGLNPHGAKIETFISAWPWGKYLSDDPISCGISPWIRIHPRSLQCDAKITGHYANSILSSLWAKNHDFHEAIVLDHAGNLAEGPGENLFLVKNGRLLTPSRGNILPGITRATVIELAERELGIKTEEKTLTPEDLFSADEAFFTGTAAEVTLIKSVDGRAIGDGENAISGQLKKLYGEVVSGRAEKYRGWLTFL